uniref:Transcriptional regulator, LysR family n=1 Tax=Solibacter usitatus (strain Ellin6076) TaxID=234267 RepID=Q025Z5_SOLUE
MVDMELEIRHLKLVETIAAEGAMTRAAARLYMTQSALSHQLAGLEESIGISLFRRVPRGMILTPAGEKLLACARSVLPMVREALESVTAAESEAQCTLRISTECYTCYHWLPSRLKAFQASFPRVEVEIVAEATRRPIDALLAGELDLAIVSDLPAQAAITSCPLFEDEMVAILSPEHRLAHRRNLSPRDFVAERLITYSVPLQQLGVYRQFLHPAGVTPARVSRVDLTEAIIEMVKANLGIAILARWAISRHLNIATLKALPLGRRGFHRKWYAITMKSRRPSTHLRAFVELLAERGALV